MEKSNKYLFIIVVVLVVATLAMSIGFAATAYYQALNITGPIEYKGATWDVHFDKSTLVETGSLHATDITVSGTSVQFDGVTLNRPGDTYEFKIGVVNDGTIDANLTSIVLNSLTEEQKKYIQIEASYDGKTYTETSTTIPTNSLAKDGGMETLYVKLSYLDNNYVLEDNSTLNLAVTLNYEHIA